MRSSQLGCSNGKNVNADFQTGLVEGNAPPTSHLLLPLQEAHGQLEVELRQLDERGFLTPAEQLRRRDIKKQKLRLKDQLLALQKT